MTSIATPKTPNDVSDEMPNVTVCWNIARELKYHLLVNCTLIILLNNAFAYTCMTYLIYSGQWFKTGNNLTNIFNNAYKRCSGECRYKNHHKGVAYSSSPHWTSTQMFYFTFSVNGIFQLLLKFLCSFFDIVWNISFLLSM